MTKSKGIIRVHPNIDIHPDGDIYVLNKKTKTFEYIGEFVPLQSRNGLTYNKRFELSCWNKFLGAFKK